MIIHQNLITKRTKCLVTTNQPNIPPPIPLEISTSPTEYEIDNNTDIEMPRKSQRQKNEPGWLEVYEH